jgi:hypothetical protein
VSKITASFEHVRHLLPVGGQGLGGEERAATLR